MVPRDQEEEQIGSCFIWTEFQCCKVLDISGTTWLYVMPLNYAHVIGLNDKLYAVILS